MTISVVNFHSQKDNFQQEHCFFYLLVIFLCVKSNFILDNLEQVFRCLALFPWNSLSKILIKTHVQSKLYLPDFLTRY